MPTLIPTPKIWMKSLRPKRLFMGDLAPRGLTGGVAS